MKVANIAKHSALIALALGVAVGCAGTPTEKEDDAAVIAQQRAADQAILDAKVALDAAKAAGAEWRDTADLIAKAEEALKAGDTAKAIKLANQARRQAENALAQKKAEDERLAAMMASKAVSSYTVTRGDSLWSISAQDDIYGNPYEWPLIYKANSGMIKDADLIYPGQEFSITRGASASEIDAAIMHAKTRGAWSLGTTEQSDMDYLAR